MGCGASSSAIVATDAEQRRRILNPRKDVLFRSGCVHQGPIALV